MSLLFLRRLFSTAPKISFKKMFLSLSYTGTIELREDTVETLLATACLLQLTAVVTACCSFLAKQLHPSNCLGFALFAEQQSCNTLLKLASAYTNHHFMQVNSSLITTENSKLTISIQGV